MNIIILMAGIFSLLAFFVHALVGDKEYQVLQSNSGVLDKHNDTWLQIRAGWHWVSVDLLLSSALLIMISTTEIISAENEILLLLSIYFFLCGVAWLITIFLSRIGNMQVILLGQWIFCFVMSGLIVWGRG